MVTTACNAATMPVIGPYLDELQKWLVRRGLRRFGADDALQRRCRVGRRCRPRPDPARRVRPGRRCARRPVVRRAARRGPPAVLRHGRHHGQGLPDRTRRARPHEHVRGRPGVPLQEGLGLPGLGAVGRPRRDRCRRRLDRPHRPLRPAQGRPRVGRCRTRPGVVRARRHASRRSPTPTSCSACSTPASFLGGDMPLDLAAAAGALDVGRRVARSRRRSTPPPASTRSSTRTWPPRPGCTASSRASTCAASPLLAFGGAGPVHACGVAELLESDRVVFPVNASVLSAFGTLVSPVRIDLARSWPRRLDAIDPAERDALLDDLRAEGRRVLAAAGASAADVRFRYGLDARYSGPGQRGHGLGRRDGSTPSRPSTTRRCSRRSRPSTGASSG